LLPTPIQKLGYLEDTMHRIKRAAAQEDLAGEIFLRWRRFISGCTTVHGRRCGNWILGIRTWNPSVLQPGFQPTEISINSMERLLEYKFEWVLPGHGHRYHAESPEAMHAELEQCVDWMKNQ